MPSLVLLKDVPGLEGYTWCGTIEGYMLNLVLLKNMVWFYLRMYQILKDIPGVVVCYKLSALLVSSTNLK